jgi:hypothetical protein
MPPAEDDEPYITWPAHPDHEVQEMFRQANRDGFVIYKHKGVYTLTSPDNTKDYQFLGRIVASSGIWRLVVRDLQNWITRTMRDEPGRRE